MFPGHSSTQALQLYTLTSHTPLLQSVIPASEQEPCSDSNHFHKFLPWPGRQPPLWPAFLTLRSWQAPVDLEEAEEIQGEGKSKAGRSTRWP